MVVTEELALLGTTTSILTEICELEELKKNTGVTNSILATARNRLANDDSQKVVKLLIDKLQKSYSEHVGFSREMQTCCSLHGAGGTGYELSQLTEQVAE